MQNYPNPEYTTGETGPGYAGGYQSQPYQQPPQQYPPSGYPPQAMPPSGYPPQTPPVAYPQQQPQMMYPQQQMAYPQQPQMMMPQMMVAPQMNVNVNIGNQKPQQHSMLIRIIYFCLVGWWLGMFWLGAALACMSTIIGLPIGLLMINRLGSVMTLSRR